MKTLLRIFLLLCPLGAFASESVTLDVALATAQARRVPVLIDFHAPWCYSCYYMARNVLTGAEWRRVEQGSVVVALDADSPEGAAVMKQWHIKALPSYLVLDPSGRELGRILGEQTRRDFYARLGDITRATALDPLAARVRDGGKASVSAGRQVLRSYHARYDAAGAEAWLAQLPAAARAALERDGDSVLLLRRLDLLRAVERKDNDACLVAGEAVLAGDLVCERPYELDKVLACAEGLPAEERQRRLAPQRAAMDRLVEQRVFGRKAQACADERSVVLSAADLYQALGDGEAEKKVLSRAVAAVDKRLAGDFKKDRNQADNLRVYLDRAGQTEALDALYPRLIAAYPDDYVYPFRYGKSLLARGKAAEALPFLEQAAPKAYGVNRLKVAEQRVKALQALQRGDEARKVVAEALQANGPWFPEDAAKLKGLL
ncbi:MAG TPA: thioredoxin family protein [Solimonas sp.]|nr:thioredoxin family protein [Solimonas sp.]